VPGSSNLASELPTSSENALLSLNSRFVGNTTTPGISDAHMEVVMIAHGRRAKSLWLALVLAPYSIRSPSGATREIRVSNQPKDSKDTGPDYSAIAFYYRRLGD